MSIYLGNLSVGEIEKRAGVSFPQELKDFMSSRQQQEASNIAKGKWHCFDIPFHMVCGDMETAQEIYRHLKPLASGFSEILAVSINKK